MLALLGHTKIESTVRYLGVEVDDALSQPREQLAVLAIADEAEAGGRRDVAREAAHAAAPATKWEAQGYVVRRTERLREQGVGYAFHGQPNRRARTR